MAVGFFNSEIDTPEALAKRRQELDYLASRIGRAQNVGTGIGDLLTGLATGIGRMKADSAEKASKASYGQDRDSFLGLLSPIGSQSTTAEPPAPAASASAVPGAFKAPSQHPVGPTMTHMGVVADNPASPVSTKAPENWLLYANKGATRDQPINGNLEKSLSFLPEMGIQMKVFSGGQDATGPRRTGSHRHDHGNAADVFFYKDGKQLDWRNKGDIPTLQAIVSRARANGVTGFGAGEGYMQPGSMHIGFGNPSVWGAGGSGANAPGWLREAFNSKYAPQQAKAPVQVASADPSFVPTPANAPAPGFNDTVPNQQTAQQQMPQPQVQAPAQNSDRLMKAYKLMTNPWAPEGDKALARSVIEQEMQRSDPAYQLKLQSERLGMEKTQAELDALRNPRMSPADAARIEMDRKKFEADQSAPIEVNGVLVDRRTMQPVYEPTPKPKELPADVQEYQFYADQEKAAGRQPVDLWTFQKGKVPQGNVMNVGGEQPDGELRKNLDKKTGELWGEYQTAAGTSASTAQDMQLLDELIKVAPQGPLTGRAAQMFPGISSAGAAFQSVVNRVAPTLRVPGSGATSDVEYEGMLKSLPGLQNKPEANAAISQMMQAKAQINMERGAIVDAYQNGDINASYARKQLQELNKRSIMSPELKAAIQGLGDVPAQSNSELDEALKLYGGE